MSKKNSLNLVLFVVVISLSGIIYFSEEKSSELTRLTEVDTNTVRNITIRHNSHTTIIKQLSSKLWSITKPVSVAANNFRISSILKLLNAPIHTQYSSSDIDLKKTGLLTAQTTITFDDKKITFGNTNPVTGLRFIRLNNRVYTIEDAYYPLLSSNFSTLVSLNLLPENSVIEKLVLLNQTITKDTSDLWKSNIDMSADNINAALDDWQSLQAFGAHEYIKRTALGDIFIFLENQEKAIQYEITDTDPWLILARPDLGLEYHLDIETYDKLITPQ